MSSTFKRALPGLMILVPAAIAAVTIAGPDRGRGSGPIVYVTGQELFFDSIVLADLPQRGRFQLLEMAGPSGLQTEYGPGDRGYVGGRWWVDANDNGMQDMGDSFFLCPLLGPGREEP